MQILKTEGVINGFRAIELNQIVPEVVDLGEHWESPGHKRRGINIVTGNSGTPQRERASCMSVGDAGFI
jgi:hypothetical protein